MSLEIIKAALSGFGNLEDSLPPRIYPYNGVNASKRVNVFISLGQSNAVGQLGNDSIDKTNVFMPNEGIYEYPNKVTFSRASNYAINKTVLDSAFVNTASKVALNYNSNRDLYVINIARGAQGITKNDSRYDHWNPTRQDGDLESLYPRAIHYITVTIRELQRQGLEPYVIGLDWNQWEAEDQALSVAQYKSTYASFFATFDAVIPNDDYKLFVCNPTSTWYGHTATIKEAFRQLALTKSNMHIYSPDALSVNTFLPDTRHYTPEAFNGIANHLLANMNI